MKQVQTRLSFSDRLHALFTGVVRGTPNLDHSFFKSGMGGKLYGMDKISKPYMQHAWTYACASRIVTPLAQCSRVLYDVNKEEESITNHAVLQVFSKPNMLMSGLDLIEFTLLALLLPSRGGAGGQCFWVLRKSNGQIVSPQHGEIPDIIWPYTDDQIRPRVSQNGTFAGWKLIINGVEKEQFEPWEIIRIYKVNPYDLLQGLAPYYPAEVSVLQDVRSDEFNTRYFDNVGAIGGYLTTGADPSEISWPELQEIYNRFIEEYTGSRSAGGVAMLPGGIEYKQFMKTHHDMQFIEQRRDNRLRLQAAYGVNDQELSIYESGMNRATANQADRAVWMKTRLPLDRRLNAALNDQWISHIDGGTLRIRTDMSHIEALREDVSDQVETAYKMWQMDVPAAEAFRRVGLSLDTTEYPWLEKKFVGMNLIDIAALAEGYIPAPAGGQQAPEKELIRMLANIAQKSKNKIVIDTKDVDGVTQANAKLTREQRDLIWEDYVRTVLDPGEKLLYDVCIKEFYSQRNEMLDNVDKWLREMTKDVEPITVDPAVFLFDMTKASELMLKKFTPEYRRQMKRERTKLKEQYGAIIQWNVTDEKTQFFVNARKAKVQSINTHRFNRARHKIASIVQEGMQNNWTPQELAKSLKEGINELVKTSMNQAKVVARTEIGSISSMSRFDAFKDSDIRQHEWLSAKDERVRVPGKHNFFDHSIDGQQRTVGQLFDTGGFGLRYPLDPYGEAGNVINCRCITLAVLDN